MKKVGFIFLGIILLVSSTVEAQLVASPKRECANCHISWMDDFVRKDVKIFQDPIIRTPVLIEGRMGIVTSEEICYTCHDASVMDSRDKTWMPGSHPVYMKPKKVKVPKAFPLGRGGIVYCGTCHSAHGVDWSKKGAQKLRLTIFLRYENPNSFLCKQCHPNKVESGDHSNHPIDKTTIKLPKELYGLGGKAGLRKDQVICQSCHVVHGSRSGYKLLIKGIDNSEVCGVCHADKYALSREQAAKKGTHPVNIVPSRRVKIPGSMFKSGAKKDSRGRFICLSCHKIHEAPPHNKLLVKRNRASSICKQCHADKDKQVSGTKHDLTVAAPDVKNIRGQRPEKSGSCGACHLPHNGRGAKMWARKPAADNDAIARLCKSCHGDGGPASKKQVGKITHPYGKYFPDAKWVDGTTTLPLFTKGGVALIEGDKGNVTCSSCHNLHQWDPENIKNKGKLKEEGDSATSFLRIKNDVGSPLCYNCHNDKSFIEKSDHDMTMMAYKHPRSHCIQMLGEEQKGDLKMPDEVVHKLLGKKEGKTGICGTCHTPHNALYYRLWSRELGPGKNPGEKLCFTCHAEGRVAEVKQLGEFTHPTGVPITNIAPDIKTKLPTFNDKLERVKNGKVMCFSCHNPHKWDPNTDKKGPGSKVEGDASNSFLRVAASDNKFALCDRCHVDKKFIKNSDHDLNITDPKAKNFRGETVAQSGICGVCHSVHNAMYKNRLWNRELGSGKDGISELCKSCHSKGRVGEKKLPGEHSHPVGLGTSILRATWGKVSEVPFPTYAEGLKKVKDGMVLCSSCHNLHVWDPTKLAEGPGTNTEGNFDNSFLRARNTGGYGLCVKCHVGKESVLGTKHDMSVYAPEERNYFGQTVARSGPCGACHVVHRTLHDIRLWSRSLGPGDDLISKVCRSCHDEGKVGKKKQISFGANSHPVNANMRRADGAAGFPLFTFDGKRVKSVDDGRVYCASCHDPHVWDPAKPDRPGPGMITEGNQANSFLRKPNLPEPNFCGECHAEKALVAGTDHDLRITAPNEKNLMGETPTEAGVCSPCHIIHNGKNNIRLWGRTWGPSFLKGWNKDLGVDPDRAVQFCTSCHSEGQPGRAKQPPRGLHPYSIVVGIRRAADSQAPLRNSPLKYIYKTLSFMLNTTEKQYGTRQGFHLYTNEGKYSDAGDLACPTCHNPHRWSGKEFKKGSGRNEEGNVTTSFLRPGFIYDFCIDCHGPDALWRAKYYHTNRGRTHPLDPKTKFDEVEMLLEHQKKAPTRGGTRPRSKARPASGGRIGSR